VEHHLGNVVSQSWGASEVTLTDAAGQAEIARWTDFYKTATTTQGVTFTTGSGDNGATDYQDLNATVLSPTPTTSFPSDEPWVLAAGGTALSGDGTTPAGYSEEAWQGSGGGFSRFFGEPDFQKALPSSAQGELAGRRGVPDVASDADPNTGMAIYSSREGWSLGGGTSAAAPLWAALVAIADQMAGHPLGYINPALYTLATSSAYAQDFRDVTQGDNTVRAGGATVQGYDATAGWDAVTGLGAPMAEKLLPDLIATVGK
jgi:subtilase family serine protease